MKLYKNKQVGNKSINKNEMLGQINIPGLQAQHTYLSTYRVASLVQYEDSSSFSILTQFY